MTLRSHSYVALLGIVIATLARAAVPDHSGPVTPDELADAKAWCDERAAALADRVVRPAAPTVRCLGQGWGTFHVGRSVNDLPLTLHGEVHATGFGTHAPSVIRIDLPDGQSRFRGVCGVDATPEALAAKHVLKFTIEADGREVWAGPPQTADMAPAAFDVDVRGVKRLTLKAVTADDPSYTPVDWCDLTLRAADGGEQALGAAAAGEHGYGSCFDFTYDGKPAAALLPTWTLRREPLSTPPDRTGERFTWTDPATGLQVSLDLTRYVKYPVVEWVEHFRNTGTADAPLLEAVRSADVLLPSAGTTLLHHNTGDYESIDGYAPHVDELATGRPMHFAPDDGRPSSATWPYFNVERPQQKRGQIVAVAWPGQWAADFEKVDDAGGRLRVSAGQELLRVHLHAGEEIRTPLTAVMFYRGDVTRSQNLWRRWILDCNTPRQHGDLPTMLASGLGLHESEKTETEGVRIMVDHHAPIQYWWLDAGWYPCKEWWDGVGTWEPSTLR